MLLALDVGNTNITFGVFDDAHLFATWRIASDREREPDEYAVIMLDLLRSRGLEPSQIHRAVLASGVPQLTAVVEEVCQRYFQVKPLRVGAGVRTGLKILYEDPREVGPDRIVDAVAALHMHKPPLIVVDLGTATVFDAVSAEGAYLGGAIAPGIGLATEALVQRAAMLRRVELVPPKTAIGSNTAAALQSGILFGYVELVEGLVRRFKAELGANAWVVATGGFASLIRRHTSVFDAVEPDLTLVGLRLVYEMNEAPAPGSSKEA